MTPSADSATGPGPVAIGLGPPGAGFGTAGLGPVAITQAEFAWIADFLRERSGIDLKDGKQGLVTSRLDRRLRYYGLETYSEYFGLFEGPDAPEEAGLVVDLLTTNETYFFREPQHFKLLPKLLPTGEYTRRSACGARPARPARKPIRLPWSWPVAWGRSRGRCSARTSHGAHGFHPEHSRAIVRGRAAQQT